MFGHPDDTLIGVEIGLLVVCGLPVVRRPAGRATPGPGTWPPRPAGRVGAWLWIPFVITAGAAARYAAVRYEWFPHGEWDAVAIYNLRARFLFLSTDNWRDAFSPVNWVPDYPLLVPATVARCWVYMNADSNLAPAVFAWVMAGLTTGVLVAGLNALRGGGQGWVAGTLLLGTECFVRATATQYADVPLSFFLLGTAVIFAVHDRTGRASPFLPAAAGMLASLAAWCKNDGLLFCVAVLVARVGAAVLTRRRAGVARDLAWVIGGGLPVAVVLAYFKACIAPPNDLVAAQGAATIPRILDWSRHALILRTAAAELWTLGFDKGILLAACAIVLGRSPADRRGPGGIGAALLLAIMVVGYYCVYLTSPHDLRWQLDTSFFRLVSQLWPLALFVFFLHVRTVDEAVSFGPKTGGPAISTGPPRPSAT